MAEEVLRSWQVPPQAADDKRKLGWVDEACQEGQSWLQTQRGYGDWRKAFNVLAGIIDADKIPAYRSQLTTGRLKRNVKEIIGTSANIRPIWGYSSDNPAFRSQATMMNHVSRAIYLENFFDLALKQTLQWASCTATGWLRSVYRRDMYGAGKGNLTFLSYGAPSVLPVQLPTSNNWQEAYAVTLMDELPIAMAHGMFPDFQDQLNPTKSQFWYSQEIRKAAQGNMFQRLWGGGKRSDNALLTDLYVPIRYTWVIDLALNKTDKPIRMGPWTVDDNGKPAPAASWSYEVPNLNGDIPVSRNSAGQVTYRKANANDARLYPYRRLIISSEKVILYDGPAFDWHGELGLVPFTLDDWAWEALGFSIVRDGYNIQQATDEIDRGTMDKIRAGLDMSMAYDVNAVTKNEADVFDPMQPRGRIGFDGSLVQQPFVPVMPTEVLRVDQAALEFRKILQDTGDYQLAINDVVSLAKARALSGDADSFEKVAQADGPIVRDISRNVERGLARVGNQVKYQILQWYDTRRIMQYVGDNGVTRETLDYDPNSLIPSHLPAEFGSSTKMPSEPSIFTKLQRARWFADNLSYFILPHSAHEIAQMGFKLGLVQLRKAGVQIDSQTIAEAWNIDLGAPFKGATPWERFFEEQEAMAEFAIRLKSIVQAISQEGIALPPGVAEALQNLIKQSGGASGIVGQAASQEGRPPTFEQTPRLVSKDNGARSTISTSGS